MPLTTPPLKVVFMGTPEFAVPILKELVEAHEVVAAITQPDRPAGRGRNILASPVKEFCMQRGIPVHQPARIRYDETLLNKLKLLNPQLIVTAAYGQLLPLEVINLAEYGTWNVHASLLPRWRGAAPINWCLLAGDPQTGITIMRTEIGLDTGDMLSYAALPIGEDDDAETLGESLAGLGAKLLVATIERFCAGGIVPQKQDENLATYAPKLNREMSYINWQDQDADRIVTMVKAFKPWPGVSFALPGGERVKILAAVARDGEVLPGRICLDETDRVIIGCRLGLLELISVQPQGRRAISASEWWRGLRREPKVSYCSEVAADVIQW